MSITSNVFQVGGSGISHSSDAAVYLIKGDTGAALVDVGAGAATERIISSIRSAGVDPGSIEYLFLTHCHYDHTGGAAEMKEKTGSQLVAHSLDAEFLEKGDNDVTAASWYGSFMKPLPVDIKVQEKKKVFNVGSLPVTMHHAPGHSPGSAVLTMVSDNKTVLFGQDVHGPLNDMLLSNREDYNQSLKYLLSLEADILCEGHFGVYYGKREVKYFIESYL